jgi:methionyl-tRNA formyltransferase
MRLVLMGTGPFAVPGFDALSQQNDVEIVHVVTRPLASKIGKKDSPTSPVREWALEKGLPLADPVSINSPDIVEWLSSLQADMMVVCDYGQILSKDALRTTRLGGINLHGSLLPRHRGAAPVQWSILSGDQQAGISTIHMTPSLDGGPVLHQCATEIGVGENAEQLEKRLSQLGVSILLQSVALLGAKASLEDCQELGQLQDKSLATKAPRLSKDDGQINCNYPIDCLDRLVRGLQPWPGAYSHLEFPDGKSLRVIIPHWVPIHCDVATYNLSPGDLFFGASLRQSQLTDERLNAFSLYIAGLDGLLGVPAIQPSGKKLMTSDEFLRGYSRYSTIRVAGLPGTHALLGRMQSQS